MIDFSIREATPQDAAGIAKVHVRTWQCAYKGKIPETYLDSLSVEKKAVTWKKALEHPQKGMYTFVAESEGKVIGWCTAGVNRDEDASQETGELLGIYVDPQYIDKGVGSQLMAYALGKLQQLGYTKATLWVLDTNQKTRQFYEKKGWKVEGKTKDDPREGFILHEVRYVIELSRRNVTEVTCQKA